jgi:hypothetical protein
MSGRHCEGELLDSPLAKTPEREEANGGSFPPLAIVDWYLSHTRLSRTSEKFA